MNFVIYKTEIYCIRRIIFWFSSKCKTMFDIFSVNLIFWNMVEKIYGYEPSSGVFRISKRGGGKFSLATSAHT